MVVSIQSTDKTSSSRKQQLSTAMSHEALAVEPDRQQLITLLQSTLDLETLLHHFLESVNDIVRVDGIAYHEERRQLNLKLGRQSSHSCGYRLISGEANYGELSFKRSRRFGENELELIESLLVLLLVPIKNSLQFIDAVRAALQHSSQHITAQAKLEKTLKREIELAKRHNHALALMTLRFESVSQRKLTRLPAQIVSEIVTLIGENCRNTDMFFRTGGKQFSLLLHNEASGAGPIGKRLRKAIQRRFGADDVNALLVKTGCAKLTGTDSVKSLIERSKNQVDR